MITESLYASHHEKGNHGYGGIWGGNDGSWHHNLIAHNSSRNPRFAGTDTNVDFRNNVVYNWGFNSAYGGEDGATINMVNNYFKAGPGTNSGVRFRIVEPSIDTAGTWTSRWYIEGNFVNGSPTITANNWAGGVQGTAPLATIRSTTPFGAANVATQTALEAYDTVLANAGVSIFRDSIDARIINEVKTGTATYGGVWGAGKGIIDSQTQVGGWPDYPVVNRAANFDTDQDGMPDAWEIARGLSPTSAAGANGNNGDFDSDGYTNLEEYINDLGAWPAPSPLVFTNALGNNRFANIANWGNTWQPSRFDTAQIRSGGAVIDAVGQAAGTLAVGPLAGNNGLLTVADGWIDVATAVQVGAAGTGAVNHFGGRVTTPVVTLGGTGAASGSYNLYGTGTLRVGTLNKGAVGGAFNFTGGTLIADTVAFSLINNGGRISPGDGLGATQVNGNLTINSGAMFLDIAGTAPGQFDEVRVTGSLAAGGALTVTLLNGYVPALGAKFDVLDFASATGSFSTLSLPALASGLYWNTSNLLTTGELLITLPPSADFNGDMIVDGQDFMILQCGLGLTGETTNAHGDANRNGTIDANDLAVWQSQYGTNPSALASAGAVPEPASCWLASLLAAALPAYRRRLSS
jgi:hypothetical protein